MKKLKQIISHVKELAGQPASPTLTQLLWQLICYPPKMALRLQQEQLIAQADEFSVEIHDIYFTNTSLQINCFKWGYGTNKVLITHGWGSKAADFSEMITALLDNSDLQIIAFDAPACGSSAGELSNLLLFADAVKAIIKETGEPEVAIGHSFGAMANVVALTNLGITPKLLVSLTPFIRLQENFIKTMTDAGVTGDAQQAFLEDFKDRYGIWPSFFNMPGLYRFNHQLNHWLAYDEHDLLLPFNYLKEFITTHPTIRTHNYDNAGHERIIKSAEVIAAVVKEVNTVLVD